MYCTPTCGKAPDRYVGSRVVWLKEKRKSFSPSPRVGIGHCGRFRLANVKRPREKTGGKTMSQLRSVNSKVGQGKRLVVSKQAFAKESVSLSSLEACAVSIDESD